MEKMMNLIEYGRPIETYDQFVSSNGEDLSLTYQYFDEVGKTTDYDIEKVNGEYVQTIAVAERNKYNGDSDDEKATYKTINTEVLDEFKLNLAYTENLGTIPPDISIYHYGMRGITTDNEEEGTFSIKTEYGDTLEFDKDLLVFYNKHTNTYKSYINEDIRALSKKDAIDIISYKDYGMYMLRPRDNIITIQRYKKRDSVYEYYYTVDYDCNIWPLKSKVYSIRSIGFSDALYNDTYSIEYDEYNMVSSVIREDSKKQPEVKDNTDSLYSRYETLDRSKNIYINTIYPTLKCDNIEDYQYGFLHLWNQDHLIVSKEDHSRFFKRMTVYVEDPIKLIDDLRSNLDSCKIEG